MFYLSVESDFSSAHQLRGYQGKCENLHGHNWKVKATAKAEILDNIGLAIDFKVLKKHLKEVLNILDHQLLNNLEYFKTKNPSAENISVFIYQKLEEKLQAHENSEIYSVEVWESDKSSVLFKKEK